MLAAALQARTASLPNVRVMCNAVAGSAGPAVFYRYNLPGTGSLRPATGLLQLFPGLKPLDQMPIEAVLPATVLEPLQFAAEGEKLLIIDLPGEELPVLQALWEATQLQLFSQVKLRCGREPHYEGGESSARILRWLEVHGFDLLSEDDSEDPDCPCWTLQRNALQLRNLDLAQQLADLQRQLKESSQIRDAQVEKLVEQKTQLEQAQQAKAAQEKLAGERQEQIQQLTQARDEQRALASEGQVRIDTLQQERDAAIKQLVEQKTQLEQAQQAKAAQEKLAGERQEQIQQLTQARDEQRALASEGQVRIDTLQQERDAAIKQLAEQKTQLEQAQQAKAAQEKVSAERLAQLEQITKARDEQSKLAGERLGQLEALKQLAQQVEQLTLAKAELEKEKSALTGRLGEAQKRLQQQETDNQESSHRQQLMHEELVRAEAQIDLIKDLLLREPGL